MLSAFVVTLFFTAGVSAWVYSKAMERTGGNTKSSLVTAGTVAAVAFVAGLVIFGILFSIDF